MLELDLAVLRRRGDQGRDDVIHKPLVASRTARWGGERLWAMFSRTETTFGRGEYEHRCEGEGHSLYRIFRAAISESER